MKRVLESIVKKVVTEPRKPLGRWKIDYCSQKINTKIDLSNEDNCGPCGQYIIDKVLDTSYTKSNLEHTNSYAAVFLPCAIHDDWMAIWVDIDIDNDKQTIS